MLSLDEVFTRVQCSAVVNNLVSAFLDRFNHHRLFIRPSLLLLYDVLQANVFFSCLGKDVTSDVFGTDRDGYVTVIIDVDLTFFTGAVALKEVSLLHRWGHSLEL